MKKALLILSPFRMNFVDSTLPKARTVFRNIFCIFFFLFSCTSIFSQATLQVTVVDGDATTTCSGPFGLPPVVQWSVDIEGQGEEIYPLFANCFNNVPMVQYSQTRDCHWNMPTTIEVCFKAFSNEALFCDINENCSESVCGDFSVPMLGGEAFDYTLELADNLDSDGFVNFRVELLDDYVGSANDTPCTALDLGILNVNSTVGSVSQSQYYNVCANQSGTAAELAPSGNIFDNQGLWFEFQTGNEPIDLIAAQAVSDPENLGDPINLQMEVYRMQDDNCSVLEHVKTQNNETENDIAIYLSCLQPNSTYLVLIDGTFGSNAGIEGYFDLQIRTENVNQAANFICDAENLGTIPENGAVGASLQTNNCADDVDDPIPSSFALNQSVWFQFSASPSGSVLISATNHTPSIGDETLDLQVAVFESDDNTCSGLMTEISSSYIPGFNNENLLVECLTPAQSYWVLIDGAEDIEAVTFDISIADTNNYPPETNANETICAGTSYNIGTSVYTESGLYTNVLTAMNGCDSIVHTTLEVATPINVNPTEVNSAMLETTLDGSATTNPSGGNPNYTYNWSNGATTQTISNIMSGNYCVTITDELGCSAEDCVEVYYIGAVVANINSDALDCYGDANAALILTSSGGTPPYSYIWENMDNDITGNGTISNENQTANIQNLGAGTYSVTVTGSLGQTATLLTEITQPDLVASEQNPLLCFGESLTIGTTMYDTEGTINEILQTTNGCDSVITGFLTILPQNSVLNPVQICASETYTIGNSIYSTTGDFDDVLMDSNGCDSLVQTQLTVLEPISVSIEIDQLATGYQLADASVSATISGGTGNYSLTWDTGDTAAIISNIEGGSTICVDVRDDLNCTAQSCEFVTYSNENIANLSSENVLCNDTNTGSMTLEAGAGLAPFTYTWEATNAGVNGSGILSQDEVFNIQNLGIGIYSVTVTDDNGVSANLTTEIDEPSPIEISIIDLQNPSCTGDCNAQFSIDVQGGTGSYSYAWSDTDVVALIGNSLCADDYFVTITDENGCAMNQTIAIVEPEAVIASTTILANVNCFQGTDGQAIVSSNNIIESVLWDNGEMTETAIQLNAGIHQVSITDTNGCMASNTVEITQPDMPVGVSLLEQESISCNDEADGILLATPSGPGSVFIYTWSNDNASLDGTLASELVAGTYTVTVSNELGCTAVESYLLEQPEALIFDTETIAATCLNDGNSGSVLVENMQGGTSPYLYSIDGNNYVTETQFESLSPGDYNIFIQDLEGCESSTVASVAAPPTVELTIPTNLQINLGESLPLSPFVNSDNITYAWTSSDPLFDCFDCGNVILEPTVNTVYNLEVIDSLTFCSDSIEFVVNVNVIRDLYVPNAFSPNDDGINDYFLPKGGIGIAQIQSMSVFDRTGNLVFQKQNIPVDDDSIGWDGNFRGKDLPEGVYVYTILVEYLDGEVLHYAGDVAIIY